jgi:hypothetical protein
MGNKITEKYFERVNFLDHKERALKEIITKTNFQLEKEIFRGQIYNKDRVGSLIYKGVWKNQPAVLKIQGLKPWVDKYVFLEYVKNLNHHSRTPQIPY